MPEIEEEIVAEVIVEEVEDAPKRRTPRKRATRKTAEAKEAEAAAEKPAKKPARRRTKKAATEEATEAPQAVEEPQQDAAPAAREEAQQDAAPTAHEEPQPAVETESQAVEGQGSEVAEEDASADQDEQETATKVHRRRQQVGKSSGQNGQFNKDRQHGKNRNRHDRNNRNREVSPSVTKEELEALKIAELRARAKELEIDPKGILKADLVQMVYDAEVRKEGFIEVEGVLDILSDGYGFLRTEGYLPGEHDVYVGTSFIRRNGLRKGDLISGTTRPARNNEKFGAIQRIATVNGTPIDQMASRPHFRDLTPVYPDERLVMEHGKQSITSRVIDLAAPIGKGQRGLIVSPPKAGKTTILKQIAASISANNPEVHLMCLLVDERPEEVTDMQRSVKGEVISSTFDMPADNHIAVAEMVIERAKRLVELGQDVVILLDSITRLARAYNLAQPASGRILSGGVDSTALYPPKRFLGAARNIEHGGSLTILASALIDTGSKMDEVIFEEFKGTGNMELKLDRNLADRRIYPAIDPVASGTRKEDLLLDPQEAPLIWAVRRILANMNNTERAMDMLIKSLKQTDNNAEFLVRTAKKAQTRRTDENFEF